MHLEYVDWDGSNMGIVDIVRKIDAFAGTLAIQDLPYVPARYHPGAKALAKCVLERSHKKLSYCKRGFKVQEYEGFGLVDTTTHHVSSHSCVSNLESSLRKCATNTNLR